jgi:hypothetical protein
MTTLAQAFSSLPEDEQTAIVGQYFGSKLFGFVAEANAPTRRRGVSRKALNTLREHALLAALSERERTKLNEMFDDAENLLA